MNKGRQLPFATIVQTHFDEALAGHCEWKKLKSRTAKTVRLTAT